MSAALIPVTGTAPPLGYRHVQLGELDRWACWWRGRGPGIVVAQIELAGSLVGYDVMLPDEVVGRAWQADVRPFFVVAS